MGLSFIQISDHHLLSTRYGLIKGFAPGFSFEAVLESIGRDWGQSVEFLVSTGDLVHQGTAAEYERMKDLLGIRETRPFPGPVRVNFGDMKNLPLYPMPGNHDVRKHLARSFFSQDHPHPTMNSAFVHEGIQFIFLDLGTEKQGVLEEEHLLFLDQRLEIDLPSVILTHHNLVATDLPTSRLLVPSNVDLLWARASKAQVLCVLSGHVHAGYSTEVKGVPVYCTSSTSFQFAEGEGSALPVLAPPGYRVIKISDDHSVSTEEFHVPLGVATDWC